MKKYKRLTEKSVIQFEEQLLSYLDKAIEKYKEALIIIQKDIVSNIKTQSILEAVNVSSNFRARMEQADRILYNFWHTLDTISIPQQREISIKLYIFGRIRLIGTNTAFTKEFPVSSNYSGSNVRSILLEIQNLSLNKLQEDILNSGIRSFQLACDSFNDAVKKHQDKFVIKKVDELIIPYDKIKF